MAVRHSFAAGTITLITSGQMARMVDVDRGLAGLLLGWTRTSPTCTRCSHIFDSGASDPPGLWIRVKPPGGAPALLGGLCLLCLARLADDQAIFRAVLDELRALGWHDLRLVDAANWHCSGGSA